MLEFMYKLMEWHTGHGDGDAEMTSAVAHEPPSPSLQSFAPHGPSTIQARFRRRLPQPLRLAIPERGAVSRIYNAGSVGGAGRYVSDTSGKADRCYYRALSTPDWAGKRTRTSSSSSDMSSSPHSCSTLMPRHHISAACPRISPPFRRQRWLHRRPSAFKEPA